MKGITIWETENFVFYAPTHAHIPREDGGHLCVTSREKYFASRADFTPKEATEVMRLTMLAGEAMVAGMKERGVEIGRINYQENGNWALLHDKPPVFHLHLYGRTRRSQSQTWGEALYFPDPHDPRYAGFEPLTSEDCETIRQMLETLAQEPRYSDEVWGLKENVTVKVKKR